MSAMASSLFQEAFSTSVVRSLNHATKLTTVIAKVTLNTSLRLQELQPEHTELPYLNQQRNMRILSIYLAESCSPKTKTLPKKMG